MATPIMRRRGFLLSIFGALLPAVVWAAWPTIGWLRRDVVGALLTDIEGARAIGRRYFALVPEEGDAAVLARRLVPEAGAVRASAGVAPLREAINARRRRDFSVGDTVIIDGWILARTEARLCALAAVG